MTDDTDRELTERERRRLAELHNARKQRLAILRLEQRAAALELRVYALEKHKPKSEP